MQDDKKHSRVLKQYGSLSSKKPASPYLNTPSLLIRDNDQCTQDHSLKGKFSHGRTEQLQSQQEDSPISKQQRVDSSEKHQEHNKLNKNADNRQRNDKVNRKLKSALRQKHDRQESDPDEDIQEFMKQVKIQGIEEKDLEEYLRKNKNVQISMELQIDKKNNGKRSKKQKKEKKIKKNRRLRVSDSQSQDQQNSKQKLKQQMFEKSQSSDLQIPQQSRAVYRNKDGTIRLHSQKQLKQQHQKKINQRLGEWQKGMKKGNSDSEQGQDQQLIMAKGIVFDDPMRRWEIGAIQQNKNPLKCKFEGYANRFNIQPGFRWDGVVRGNGFENKYLQEQNLKKADQMKQQRQYLKNL